MANENGKWITVNGNHIFIKDGQTVEEALKERFDSDYESDFEEIDRKNKIDSYNPSRKDAMKWVDSLPREKQQEIWKQFTENNPNNLNYGTYVTELMNGGNKYLDTPFDSDYESDFVDDNNNIPNYVEADDTTNDIASNNARNEIAKIKKTEPKVTKDLYDVVKSAGGRLDGIEFRVKTVKSLARKLRTTAQELGIKPEDVTTSDMHDMLRYTSEISPDNFVDEYNKTIKAMQDKGYKLMKVKNHFQGEGSDIYRDINTNFQAPDGTIFELQFNTSDGLKAKDKGHVEYETYRDTKATEEQKNKSAELMRGYWKNVPIPKGIENIKNYSGYNK